MTAIFEVLLLQGGYAAARVALRDFVENAMREGAPVWTEPAVVRFGRPRESPHVDELWSVRWMPKKGAAYPQFSGLVGVHQDAERTQLEIRGDYVPPPYGIERHGFDLVAGQRSAAQMCKHLLGEIAARIERRCPG